MRRVGRKGCSIGSLTFFFCSFFQRNIQKSATVLKQYPDTLNVQIRMLCFVLINSVLLNLSCVWINVSHILPRRTISRRKLKAAMSRSTNHSRRQIVRQVAFSVLKRWGRGLSISILGRISLTTMWQVGPPVTPKKKASASLPTPRGIRWLYTEHRCCIPPKGAGLA